MEEIKRQLEEVKRQKFYLECKDRWTQADYAKDREYMAEILRLTKILERG